MHGSPAGERQLFFCVACERNRLEKLPGAAQARPTCERGGRDSPTYVTLRRRRIGELGHLGGRGRREISAAFLQSAFMRSSREASRRAYACHIKKEGGGGTDALRKEIMHGHQEIMHGPPRSSTLEDPHLVQGAAARLVD